MNALLTKIQSLFSPLPGFALTPEMLLMTSSAVMSLSVVLFCWGLLSIMWGKRNDFAEDYFERTRREKLRTGNSWYRQFEPLIDDLSKKFQRPGSGADKIRDNLPLLPGSLPWRAPDFLAMKLLEGVLLALAGFLLFFWFVGPIMGGILAVGAVFGYLELCKSQVNSLAFKRLYTFKKRLPYAVDLMALMMQAGAGFQESLRTIVQDNVGHPLSEEFGEVLRDIELGQSRREALEKMHQRINDDDVRELIFAIIKGEELGTPLSQIFRNQADQMRLKRSQWAEKAAANAQVKMVFPGIVIMVACLLVVISPFVMKVVDLLFG